MCRYTYYCTYSIYMYHIDWIKATWKESTIFYNLSRLTKSNFVSVFASRWAEGSISSQKWKTLSPRKIFILESTKFHFWRLNPLVINDKISLSTIYQLRFKKLVGRVHEFWWEGFGISHKYFTNSRRVLEIQMKLMSFINTVCSGPILRPTKYEYVYRIKNKIQSYYLERLNQIHLKLSPLILADKVVLFVDLNATLDLPICKVCLSVQEHILFSRRYLLRTCNE